MSIPKKTGLQNAAVLFQITNGDEKHDHAAVARITHAPVWMIFCFVLLSVRFRAKNANSWVGAEALTEVDNVPFNNSLCSSHQYLPWVTLEFLLLPLFFAFFLSFPSVDTHSIGGKTNIWIPNSRFGNPNRQQRHSVTWLRDLLSLNRLHHFNLISMSFSESLKILWPVPYT